MKNKGTWFKSSYSGSNGGNCVEVNFFEGGTVGIRDSKLGNSSPVLEFTPSEFAAFVDGAKDDEFRLA